ncbi:MAG: cytochrome c3 family protein [Desulfosalsimonas sp.]
MILILCALVLPVKTFETGASGTGAEEICLQGGRLGEVEFPHLLHQKTPGDCSTCHDMFPREKDAILMQQEAGELKKQQVMNMLCIKCHVARQSVLKPSGPTKCAKCHQK